MRIALAAVVLLGAACGNDPVHHLPDGPKLPDARTIDAPVVSSMATPAYDVVSGAHHVSGSRFSADVQIGHAIGQQPVTNGTKRVEGNSAVKP